MRLIEINGMPVYGFSFRSLDLAQSFALSCETPYRVILGDHPCVWVVSPADAERLVKAGYDYAI
jgi:hypothetical protein